MTVKYGKFAPRLILLDRQKWLCDWLVDQNYAFVNGSMDDPDPAGAFPTMPFDEARYHFSLSGQPVRLELLKKAHRIIRQLSEQGHPRIAAGPHTVILHSEHAWIDAEDQLIERHRDHSANVHALEIAFAAYQPDSAADSSGWVRLPLEASASGLHVKDLVSHWEGAELMEFLAGWSISPKEEA